MEVESLELTVDDVLRLHRGWITKLFVNDRKSEVEIVELLPSHIRKCIQDWDLLSIHSPSPRSNLELEPDVHSLLQTDLLSTQSSSPRPNLQLEEPHIHNLFTPASPELQIDTRSVSDDWELIKTDSHTPSRSRLSIASNLHSVPDSTTYNLSPLTTKFDNPEASNLHDQRPLSTLPTSSNNHKRKFSDSLDRPTKDKLKLTCHHGDEFHPVEMTLSTFNQGPSPIETYAIDDQSHERLAIALERESDRSSELPRERPRRAGERCGSGGPRTRTITIATARKRPQQDGKRNSPERHKE